MKKPLTTIEFIERAKKAHIGESLDFSKVEYVNNSTPVCIIDHDVNPDTGKEYGEYWQRPQDCLNGHKNPAKSKRKKLTTSEFIARAKKVHKNENLDYSKAVYINRNTPICIIDHDINPKTGKEYGEYWQAPSSHLKGIMPKVKSAILAGIKKTMTTSEFIARAKKVHKNENLDYSKVNYTGIFDKVCIIDHDINPDTGEEYGEFWQRPVDHLNGCKCPIKSKIENTKKQTSTLNNLIEKINKNFPYNNLDFSKTRYINSKEKIIVIDHSINPITKKEYGEFTTTPNKLLRTGEHPLKGYYKSSISQSLGNKEFIEKANIIHHNTYDYSEVNYINAKTKVCIIDPVYGKFWQTPDQHLHGHGNILRAAAQQSSKIEKEIISLCRDIMNNTGQNIDIQNNKRIIQGKKEIDIYIPSLKIGFEVDGLYWHNSQKKNEFYHINKTIDASNKGIELYHIFEDEWIYRKEALKNKLRNILSRNYNRIPYISTNNIICLEHINKEALNFLSKYSLYNKLSYYISNNTIIYQVIENKKIISMIVFSYNNNEYIINDIINLSNYNNLLLYKMILDKFINDKHPSKIIAKADIRWNPICSNIYKKLGFQETIRENPQLWYIYGKSKRSINKLEDSNFNIYDCGISNYSIVL